MTPIRVLVVDDSAFARKVLREILERTPGIEVVGIARDGLEALEKCAELKPDVMTLDLIMPNLDGVGVLKALPKGGPRVVVVSISDALSDVGVEALESGAVDLVQKPTALATERLYELRAELVEKVSAAAGARPAPALERASIAPVEPVRAQAVRTEVVGIGASTGGPQALTRLLAAFPEDFPAALAVALHIPAGYTDALARRLDELCRIEVLEAQEGLELRPGRAVVAMGGINLEVRRDGGRLVAHLDPQPFELHRPSIDVLFRSLAKAAGGRVLGVVLTGMGSDGVAGARAIRERGGKILTEAESSCVVYGMPRAVVEAGLSDGSAPLGDLAREIASRL